MDACTRASHQILMIPGVPVDRDAVNYGHCVSFGLSGCDINDPDATYNVMEGEGISHGYDPDDTEL